MLHSIFLSIYQFDYTCIIISWDKLALQKQTHNKILDNLLADHPSSRLKYQDLNTKTAEISIETNLITLIGTPKRLDKLNILIEELVKRNKKIRIFIDEADALVMSSDRVLENYFINQILKKDISIYYFTATSFSLYTNSSRINREPIVIQMPTKLYSHLEYRDYYKSFHQTTEILEMNDDKKTTDLILNTCKGKGRTALINIDRKNEPKKTLAIEMASRKPNGRVIVYTGDGFEEYLLKNNIIQINKLQNLYCIEDFLESVDPKSNVYIISTLMASRAQTFKNYSGTRILTHLYLRLSKKAGLDTILQSLRGSGQYLYTQEKLTIWASSNLHDKIKICLYNNNALNAYPDPYKYIFSINFLMKNVPIPFTNKKLPGYTIEKNSDYSCETHDYQMIWTYANYLKESNDYLKPIMLTTGMENIPMYQYIKFLETLLPDIDIKNRIELIKNKNNLAFHKMNPSLQHKTRQWIKKTLKIDDNKKMQMAYNEKRYKILNQMIHERPVSYQCDIVAMDPNNFENINVVFWKTDYIKYNGHIGIWQTTNGMYRCGLIGKEERENIKFFKIKES